MLIYNNIITCKRVMKLWNYNLKVQHVKRFPHFYLCHFLFQQYNILNSIWLDNKLYIILIRQFWLKWFPYNKYYNSHRATISKSQSCWFRLTKLFRMSVNLKLIKVLNGLITSMARSIGSLA